MIMRVIAFTDAGISLAEKIKSKAENDMQAEISIRDGRRKEDGLSNSNYVSSCFEDNIPLIFIGACGIAVRLIAPYVKDKLKDIPVVVIDDTGKFVIPILSGHVGGANELAIKIADLIGAVPVITTATDNHGAFAVDIFAKENNLAILNKDGIAKVSAKALKGENIVICDMRTSEHKPDVIICDKRYADKPDINALLYLCPRRYVLGIGCKKGKDSESLKNFVYENMEKLDISKEEILSIATIDIKKEEECIKALARDLSVDINLYTAAELEMAEGEFSSSEFVEKTVGVSNVCERAAKLAAGKDSKIVLPKTSKDGMTLAIYLSE